MAFILQSSLKLIYNFSRCGQRVLEVKSARTFLVVREFNSDQSLFAPANTPLVLDKSVLNRVLYTVTNCKHCVVQTSDWTQTSRHNAAAVKEERVVSDSETDVEWTFT